MVQFYLWLIYGQIIRIWFNVCGFRCSVFRISIFKSIYRIILVIKGVFRVIKRAIERGNQKRNLFYYGKRFNQRTNLKRIAGRIFCTFKVKSFFELSFFRFVNFFGSRGNTSSFYVGGF